MTWLFDPSSPAPLPVVGRSESFPVRRIFCVGRNYAAHAREMGADPSREAPFFFTKPAEAVITNAEVPYPSMTADLHHEVELVCAIGGEGADLTPATAAELLIGWAVGVDLTRRDIQAEAKTQGRPWDAAKGFDASAPCGCRIPTAPSACPSTARCVSRAGWAT